MFRCPVIHLGKGAINKVTTLKGERALIVTDKNLTQLGHVGEVEKRLQAAKMNVKVFDGVEPDPKDSIVFDCFKLATDFKPDWFIGLGGGSAMDIAKAAFVLYERPDIKISSFVPLMDYGLRKKSKIAAIPTTSGTGSEVTYASIITDSKTGRKLALVSYELIPDVAIVDPTLAFKMPPKLRADTGLDVLVHAVECYMNKMGNRLTSTLAMKAIQTVFRFLEKSFKEGDQEAMEEMHYAATQASMAWTNSGLGIAHSIGHSIGAVFHIPHGPACGIALPYTIEYSAKACKPRYLEILQALQVKGVTLENSTENLSSVVKELVTRIQEPTTIKGLGIDEEKFKEKIPTLTSFAASDLNTTVSPRIPPTKDFTAILEYMLKDKPIDF
nr:iron-containing alcohol dehydrogenase [Candidatus Njordarchaeota archaeon]